jgi:hypothetical protein
MKFGLDLVEAGCLVAVLESERVAGLVKRYDE